jgi:hypothetical protein
VGDHYRLVYWDVGDGPNNTLNFDDIGQWDRPPW